MAAVVLIVAYLYCVRVESRLCMFFFFFQAEDGIRDLTVTGVQTCALPIFRGVPRSTGLGATGAAGRAPRAFDPLKPRRAGPRGRSAPGSRGGAASRGTGDRKSVV